jgi:hypothetical protein
MNMQSRTVFGARWNLQRGQAMAEFVTLAAVIVPMLLLFPVVYKLIDMMQTTEQAGRYVAFEHTVHPIGTVHAKSSETLATEVGRRLFSRSDSQMLTGEGMSQDDAERLPLWRDLWGRHMVDPAQDFGNRVEINNFNAVHALVPFGSNLAHSGSGFGLRQDRMAVASVSVDPNLLPRLQPFDTMALRLNRKGAVLTDTWAAQGPGDVRRRFDDMGLFYNPLGQINEVLTPFGHLLDVVSDEPIRDNGGFSGDGAWELLPCDRVRGNDRDCNGTR